MQRVKINISFPAESSELIPPTPRRSTLAKDIPLIEAQPTHRLAEIPAFYPIYSAQNTKENLNRTFNISETETDDLLELNSYKFARPREYNPNLYESENLDNFDLLSDISLMIGPKERPAKHVAFLEEMLKKSVKPKKFKPVSVNNIQEDPTFLKGINLIIDQKPILALMDTGSTHNLLSHTVFQTLKNRQFLPMKIDMCVAGSTLTNNIVGQTQLNTVFATTTGSITIPITYLIAHLVTNQ